MTRRAFVTAVVGALYAAPHIVGAQPRGPVYRLGILSPGRLAPEDPYSFTVPLKALGYVEGRNLIVDRRYAEGQYDRLPAFARELAALPLKVILAVGSSAIQAAKDATTTIPIVLLANGDPVAAGFVRSLGRPEANITGVLIAPEGSLAGKRLELLMAFVPRGKRVALLAPVDSGATWLQQLVETKAAAAALGLGLDVVEVQAADYRRAFAAIAALRPQALVVGASGSLLRDRKEIIALAAEHRLPAIYEWPRQVKEGGLMSYGANEIETYQQVASYIDRIFRGAKPADMPIWQPSKLHLVINRRTANALGLTIPQSLLLRANEVIE